MSNILNTPFSQAGCVASDRSSSTIISDTIAKTEALHVFFFNLVTSDKVKTGSPDHKALRHLIYSITTSCRGLTTVLCHNKPGRKFTLHIVDYYERDWKKIMALNFGVLDCVLPSGRPGQGVIIQNELNAFFDSTYRLLRGEPPMPPEPMRPAYTHTAFAQACPTIASFLRAGAPS